MKTAIYPGSFDPITLGHIDIIERASAIFDKIIVAVLINQEKKSSFSLDEKLDFIKKCTKNNPKVSAVGFNGLLADFAKTQNSNIIIKGLRAVSDFDYEFQMALANRKLNENIDTVFLNSSEQYLYLSSSLVRDIASHGGDTKKFVHIDIADDVEKKLKNKGDFIDGNT